MFNKQFTIHALAILGFLFATPLSAQNILVETPFNTISDSYYENHGVNFGFTLPGGRGTGSRIVGYGPGGILPNIGFNQNSIGSAIPAFGGYDPNADLNTGFGYRNGNGGGFNLGLRLGKGSTRSNVTTAPSVMVQNGYGGSISDGSVRPFVTGVVPVIGNGRIIPPPMDNAVTRAIQSGQLQPYDARRTEAREEAAAAAAPRNYSDAESTAMYGDSSVAAIKAAKAARRAGQQATIDRMVAAAQELEEAGQYREARNKYREASKLTSDKSMKKKLREMVNAIIDK